MRLRNAVTGATVEVNEETVGLLGSEYQPAKDESEKATPAKDESEKATPAKKAASSSKSGK